MQNKRISRVFCLFVLGNIIINQQSHTYSLTMFCNRVVRFLFFVFQNLVLLIPYLIMHFRQILGSWQSTYQWTGKLLPVVFYLQRMRFLYLPRNSYRMVNTMASYSTDTCLVVLIATKHYTRKKSWRSWTTLISMVNCNVSGELLNHNPTVHFVPIVN